MTWHDYHAGFTIGPQIKYIAHKLRLFTTQNLEISRSARLGLFKIIIALTLDHSSGL